MTELKVLHIVARWGNGGAAPSIVVEAEKSRQAENGIRHQALALEPGASSQILRNALMAGMRVHVAPDPEREAELIDMADVIVLHFWSTPSVLAFIDRWRGRELRWILHVHTNGLQRPQRLPPALANNACHAFLTAPVTRQLVGHDRINAVPAVTRLIEEPAIELPETPRRIVHAGTITVFKLSPDFIPLHAGALSAENPMMIAGSGGGEEDFAAEAEEAGVADRFRWLGFQPNLAPVFASGSVFAYPVSPFSYAAADRVVQEAQSAGLPVLIGADTVLAHLISDGETGILTHGAEDYRQKLMAISAGDLALPSRRDVQEAALAAHDPAKRCRLFCDVYRRVSADRSRPLDDGLPTAQDWLEFQIGDPTEAAAARRPTLTELRNDAVLSAHQRWAAEGGLAQFANARAEIMDMIRISASRR